MWPVDSESDRSLYIDETPADCYERRMRWRQDDVIRAQTKLARARAFNRGRRRIGRVPVYADDASEKSVQEIIRRLNFASYGR